MEATSYYKQRFQKQYGLNVSFWKSFLNFFGIYPNLYEDALQSIANKSVKQALLSDAGAIQQDGIKVMRENKTMVQINTRLKYAT